MNRGIIVAASIAISSSAIGADRYVGAVDGAPGAVRVAVVANQQHWIVYVCGDSDETNHSLSRWWKGSQQKDEFAAVVDGAVLSAKKDGDAITGSVQTDNGKIHAFKATKVSPGARAGAYRAEAAGHVLGWIVDGEGLVVGCNKGDGKRVALKPAKLAPPLPKPVARRKPKVADDADEEAEAPAEKPVKKEAKAAVKKAAEEKDDEEDAEPKGKAEADDEDGEEFVGEKVTSAKKPAKGRPAAVKKVAEKVEQEDEDAESAKKPADKKKPAGDDDA